MSFWSQFDQASCYPDKCQCEAVGDGLIRMPSAFWSSFAYIIAAIAIYKVVARKSMELKLWAGVCFLMGISSLFGHASFIRYAMAMDFASIVLVLSFFALLNLFLMLKISYRHMLVYFFLYYASLFVAMSYMNKWAKVGVCVLIFFFSLSDMIREMGWKFLKAKMLQLSIFILTISFGMFLVDEFHIGCDPSHWFQWHSVWHMGTALSMFFYGQWRFAEMRER